jgi:hypothetical protein
LADFEQTFRAILAGTPHRFEAISVSRSPIEFDSRGDAPTTAGVAATIIRRAHPPPTLLCFSLPPDPQRCTLSYLLPFSLRGGAAACFLLPALDLALEQR